MTPVWRAAQTTVDFRDLCHSNWEFPEWIPNVGSWQFLSRREAEKYLPQEATSPPFTVLREGITEDGAPHRLSRYVVSVH
ncbi:general transcription factor 3C polypeptide 2-like [Ascaphus truei]|uniref:general transcription factor 3C polypeptide 2-like n=1 Tax=Ascaphus truei TaxID=8439 RepID=UPI003F59C085